jgi:hypothetical protein
MNHFILEEVGQCYQNGLDKIFPRMGLSTNLVRLQTLK